ncbi:MAG TPA: hypothetical protein VGN23_07585 [Verrucomicrobiae bacterium]|jgi:hypothetical protein
MMRKTGYILLILGFLRLAWVSLAIDALPRPISEKYDERFHLTNSFSGEQLHKNVVGAIGDYHRLIPSIILPATLMLAGGILLGQAFRRDIKRKAPIIQDERPVT